MTDLIIGVIFVSCLVGIGLLFVQHSNKVRQEMFAQMDAELEEEETQEPEPQPEKPKPATKMRRRSKKKNG